MADQKVSDLPSLNGADVDAADLLYIIDSSAGSAGSKKITVGQYQLAPVSGGTANGVLYLNASKVVTAGSDLVFDGTNFSTTGTTSATKLIPTGGSATGNGMYLPAANTLAWSNNGLETLRLDASGNLGLGVTPVAYTTNARTFHIDGGANSTQIRLTNNTTGVAQTNGGLLSMDGNQLSVWNVENDALRFGTNDTERARITSSGQFLVGQTSSSGWRTSFTAETSGVVGCSLFNVTEAADYPVACVNQATSGDNQFVWFLTEAGGSASRGGIDYNRAGGLVRYNTTSDYRAKDIIGPVQNPGATIDALKVYEGVMKGATQSRPMLIAHEAQEHVPFCVSGTKDEENEDGTPKFQQMDHASLVPLLIAEIQSLRARVAALESA